jgi:uncharacterized membrane protein HdeD (DUF308 family)
MFVDRSVFWIWSLIGILGIVAAILVLNHPLFAAVLLPATLVLYLGVPGAAGCVFSRSLLPLCADLTRLSTGIAAVAHPTRPCTHKGIRLSRYGECPLYPQ